jgi:hypothetical protein
VYVKLGGLALIVNAFDFHLAPLPPSASATRDRLAEGGGFEPLVPLAKEPVSLAIGESAAEAE